MGGCSDYVGLDGDVHPLHERSSEQPPPNPVNVFLGNCYCAKCNRFLGLQGHSIHECSHTTLDLVDGTILERGLSVSRKGGYNCAVYRCKCGREQTAQCAGYHGGLSESAAERFGWRMMDGEWQCPYCTGNTKVLNRLFDGRGSDGKEG